MDTPFGLSEGALRFGIFIAIFAVMALLELALPKRALGRPKGGRWFTNLAIAGIDSLVVRLMALFVIPVAAVAAAAWAQAQGWGLLNQVGWPAWLEVLIAVVVLDLAIYAQHVASHKIPIFWQLHKVHHADRDIDVTTGIRFHPIEIAISMLWKIVVVLALGAVPIAVVLFEVILNGCALFNHSNVALPHWLDRVLRLWLVTPDMHRVHHSVLRREHDSNYGFNLSVWDRLFRTYVAQPERGHDGMTIGLAPFQSEGPARLWWSLALPFTSRSDRKAGKRSEKAHREIA